MVTMTSNHSICLVHALAVLSVVHLSTRAVKDYNRGRTYLASIARKNKIPLYTNPIDAALCAVYIVKGYELPQNHIEENDISLLSYTLYMHC